MRVRVVSIVVALTLVVSGVVVSGQQASAFDNVPPIYQLDPYTTTEHPPLVVPGPDIGTGLPAGSSQGGSLYGATAVNGRLRAGVTVSALLFNAPGQVIFSRSATSDAGGQYTLADLPAGDYWVQFYDASDPKHVLQSWRSVGGFYPDGATVPVTPGSSTEVAGFPAENGAIVGHVDCSDGCDHAIDYSKTVVDIYIADQGLGFYPTAEQRAAVDGSGAFRFDVAQPGEYVAVVRYSGTDFGDAEVGAPFLLGEGQTATVPMTLREVRPNLHSGNPLGPAPEANVYGLYWDLLHRTPSVDDVKGWLAGFDYHNSHPGDAPQIWLSRSFIDSDEYRLLRIDDAYQSILGRASDAGGRATWLADMKLGYITTDDILKSLYESAEYYQRHGGSNTTFAKSLYSALLGRTGSAPEYAWWSTLADQHGRNWVVDEFWKSDETASDRVSAMYASYLGRVPDAQGLADWKAIDLRVGDSAARQGIVASNEYYGRCFVRFDVS